MPRKNAERHPGQGTALLNITTPITSLQATSAIAPEAVAAAYRIADLPDVITERGVTVDEASGCWRAGGRHDRDGYARTGDGEGVHRIAWRALVGKIPADRPIIDHVRAKGCVWRDCCRPDHLEAVTARVNTLRGRSFAAVNAAKDQCDHGHPYDLYNTYYKPNGNRDCRACIRRRVREYQQRQRTRPPKPETLRAELRRAA